MYTIVKIKELYSELYFNIVRQRRRNAQKARHNRVKTNSLSLSSLLVIVSVTHCLSI